jgi:hypothetical protein
VNNIIPIVFSSSTDYPQPTTTSTMTSTYHTYPDLVYDKGRLAETTWLTEADADDRLAWLVHVGDALSAIIAIDPEAVVFVVKYGEKRVVGLRPGGLG